MRFRQAHAMTAIRAVVFLIMGGATADLARAQSFGTRAVDENLLHCLLPEAENGKYSSSDNGRSAGNLLEKCTVEWAFWVDDCQLTGSTKENCITRSAIIAQMVIKRFGK